MEHVLTVGINIDDVTVQNSVINQCTRKVMEDIQSSVLDGYYTGNKTVYQKKLRELVSESIDKFCENNKDFIINEAIIKLVEKLSRTKAVKEKLENL